MLVRAKALELSTDARNRLRWIQYYLTHNCNASLTCRYYGIARSTFLRWLERFDPSDPTSLEDSSRRPKTLRSEETPLHVVSLVRSLRKKSPFISRTQIVDHLLKEYGVEISPATAGRIIARHGLFFGDTKAHRQKLSEWKQKHGHPNDDTEPTTSFAFLPTS